MPAASPALPADAASRLAALGTRIRDQRKRHKVSATTAAEAAGLSRATLHRIERGEPSVTMGAYLGAMAALGLELDCVDADRRESSPPAERAGAARPARILLADYPQLRSLAWQRADDAALSPREALELYERGWRHLDAAQMAPHERALVESLAATLGGGRLLV